MLTNAHKYLTMEEYQDNVIRILNDQRLVAYYAKRYDIIRDVSKKQISLNLVASYTSLNFANKNHEADELIALNNELIRTAETNTEFIYEIFLPESYDKSKKYPLFINFHGDGDSNAFHRAHWNEQLTTSIAFITEFVQSNHIVSQCRYTWTDYNAKPYKMYDDFYDKMADVYNEICKEYNIDEDNIVLAGFSGGASTAVDCALSGAIPVKGAISLGPDLTQGFNEDTIKASIERGTKLVLIDGELEIGDSEIMYDKRLFEIHYAKMI